MEEVPQGSLEIHVQRAVDAVEKIARTIMHQAHLQSAKARITVLEAQLRVNSPPEEDDVMQKKGKTSTDPA